MKWNPATAARRGAIYLDAVKPDWYRVITLASLRLTNRRCCVLGQCFNDYFAALEILVPAVNGVERTFQEEYANRYEFAVRCGFQVPHDQQHSDGYKRLGLAWTRLIRQRRRSHRRAAA